MKIKLDENLPFSLAILLRSLGHDVHTAQDEGLTGHSDREIWEAAQKESKQGQIPIPVATPCVALAVAQLKVRSGLDRDSPLNLAISW